MNVNFLKQILRAFKMEMILLRKQNILFIQLKIKSEGHTVAEFETTHRYSLKIVGGLWVRLPLTLLHILCGPYVCNFLMF